MHTPRENADKEIYFAQQKHRVFDFTDIRKITGDYWRLRGLWQNLIVVWILLSLNCNIGLHFSFSPRQCTSIGDDSVTASPRVKYAHNTAVKQLK